MIIALAQNTIKYGERDINLKNSVSLIEKASREGSDAIFFPEMSMTGVSIHKDKSKNKIILESQENPVTVNFFKEKAIQYNIAIGFGWGKEAGEKGENHYSIVNSHGEIILDYAKIHPFTFGYENEYFKGGESLEYCRIKEFNIGVGICYDLRFPEVFTGLGKKCDLIINPSNWPYIRHEAWEVLLKARAIENQVYMAAVNCAGESDGIKYKGESTIINPEGKVLIKAGFEEDVIIWELENDVKKYRDGFPVLKDRREDIYKSFY